MAGSPTESDPGPLPADLLRRELLVQAYRSKRASILHDSANCYSLPTKLRLPLLHERRDALLGFLATEQGLHQFAFDLQALPQRPVYAPVDSELDRADRLDRAGGKAFGVLQGLLFQLVGGEQPVEDAELVCFGGREPAAGDHQVQGFRDADEARQALGAAVPRQETQSSLR